MVMNQPSVSIIIPVYNVELYIEACIQSVMRQTYEGPIECIIVDDGSTDNSIQIAEDIISKHSGSTAFQILHHSCTLGPSAARNTGLRVATGEYYFFLDSDDELTEDCILKLTEPLNKCKYDIVQGNLREIKLLSSFETRRVRNPWVVKLADNSILYQPDILRTHRTGWNQVVWNKLYKASFIIQNKIVFKEGIVHEDDLFTFQVACLASSMYVVNQITYIYKKRINPEESITGFPLYEQRRASVLCIILKEMNMFVESYHIDRKEVFKFFDEFFLIVLRNNCSNRSQFVAKYRELRPCIRKPLQGIIHNNRLRLRRYLRDVHYLLPSFLAPYWLFFFLRLTLFLRQGRIGRPGSVGACKESNKGA